MLCSHFRQRCIFLKEIIYYLFLIGESLTAVETDKKNKGCGIPRAIEPRPLFFPSILLLRPRHFFLSLPLSLSCQLHKFPLYFLPLPPNKKGSLEKKKLGFFFRCILCWRRRRRRKKPAFSEKFSRKMSAASVRANIFGRGLHPPAEMATLYWGQRC